MRISFRIGFFIVLGAVVIGAALGYLLTPRYNPPADDGEARLRERATEYYRALQIKDLWTISRLYTPARQLADRDDIVKLAEYEAGLFQRFEEKTKQQLQGNAAGILPENLEVKIYGDWAVTGGVLMITEGEREIPVPLGEMSWVRTGGDWWIYIRRPSELNAYGNPPDEVIAVAQDQNSAQRREVQQYEISLNPEEAAPEEEAADGEAPEAGADETGADGSGDDAAADNAVEGGAAPAEDDSAEPAADDQDGAEAADNPEESND
ncbi:hypothetical protein JW859_15280 [bacterium]|nr:hypothetical protein [bacterium]